ncbi:FMN-binding protein [Sporanaerobacter acetigenes]|uniref:FMN-binding protein n=1 Tax=Sporanaerobacter acetigenes TaxID=165813 RepID=UPI001044AB22|nr:FMN-binding protein [Sporanaerobacter acetigenes]
MKNKYLALILVLVLVLAVFSGCSDKEAKAPVEEDSEETASSNLNDGKYLIKMPVSDHGNYPMATLEVKDGEIISFDYNEYLADTGEEKNESNYSYKEGLEVLKNLNEQFMEKKDVDSIDYDAVSGATHTKASFKEVVNALLEKAEKGETYEPVFKDGEYEAKADEASHGWLAQIKIVVKEGTIVGVNYEEVAVEDMEGQKVVVDEENKPVMGDDGNPKTEPTQVKTGDIKSMENYAYLPSLDTAAEFEKQIIDNNGVENLNLDAISGATHTRDNVVSLATKALESAK